MSDVQLMSGFPPQSESRVTLANWQHPPYNRWSFQHLRELIPSQRISRGMGACSALAHDGCPLVPEDVTVNRLEGRTSTLEEVLAETFTDAVVILHEGRIVLERYANGMTAESPHLLMSVTKSVVGCVAGILVDRGLLDPDEQASTYAPEIIGSGYDGATVRDLLDMRTGVQFSEEYTDEEAEVRVMERSMGWSPVQQHADEGGMYAYLTTLTAGTAHGGPFVYRSADTDMLGWVCERAADTRMADLISQLIWAQMGTEFDAEITCDRIGSAIHDGGMSARARDMARFGQLIIDEGMLDAAPIVPAQWLRQSSTLDPDIRGAFAASDSEPFLAGGWYRNQFWFLPGPLGDVQACLGIHGQLVLVDRATRTVSVKMSTWPTAQNPAYLLDTIRAFMAVGQQLSGLTGTGHDPAHLGGPIGVVGGR